MKFKFLLLVFIFIPLNLIANGYKESIIAVSAIVNHELGPGGNLETEESEAYKDYYSDDEKSASFDGASDNYQLDLYVPYRFEFAKIMYLKFGLMGVKGSASIDETVSNGGGEDGEDVGKYSIMEYKYMLAGPTVSINVALKYAHFGAQIFTLYGHIYDGKYEAVPYMRDQGYVLDRDDYSAGFDGYSIMVGDRLYVALTKVPLFIFTQFYFTYAHIQFNDKLTVYGDFDGKSNLVSLGLGLGAGIYF